MVCLPAPAQRDVKLLAGLSTGQDGVGGVDGDALGAMDRDGVAEFHVVGHIPGRQGDVLAAGLVGGLDCAGGVDAGDGPAVSVLDPVGGAGSQAAVVEARDDQVPDGGLVPVRQQHSLLVGRGECQGVVED